MSTSSRTKANTIDDYIAGYPLEVRTILQEVRRTIRKPGPRPRKRSAIKCRRSPFRAATLVYFGAFKKLYPPVRGDARLEKALAPYAGPKGNLQFPLDRPIPYDLITRIVKFRLKQNTTRRQKR